MGAHTRCAAGEQERLEAALDAECVGLDASVREMAKIQLMQFYRLRPPGPGRVAGELHRATAIAAREHRRANTKGDVSEYYLACVELEADHVAKTVLNREVDEENTLSEGTSRAQHPTSRASGGPPEGNDAD